jgi:hypothetical protein
VKVKVQFSHVFNTLKGENRERGEGEGGTQYSGRVGQSEKPYKK